MNYHECTLNIWYHLPKETLEKVHLIYERMPGWLGYRNKLGETTGIPFWYSFDEEQKSIYASVEASGLQICATMDEADWNNWITSFKKLATEILNYKVGEIEHGEV